MKPKLVSLSRRDDLECGSATCAVVILSTLLFDTYFLLDVSLR